MKNQISCASILLFKQKRLSELFFWRQFTKIHEILDFFGAAPDLVVPFSQARGIDSENFLDQTEAIDPRMVLEHPQQNPVSRKRATII